MLRLDNIEWFVFLSLFIFEVFTLYEVHTAILGLNIHGMEGFLESVSPYFSSLCLFYFISFFFFPFSILVFFFVFLSP